MAEETPKQPGLEIEEIPPTEDLMREHGVLKRILLIYEDVILRLHGQKPWNPFLVSYVTFHAATIVRRFIEDYHQMLEEQYVFPHFLQAGKQVDLVRVLLEQHQAARQLTDLILHSSAWPRYHWHERVQLAYWMYLYVRMYEPHEAREDTVLFPAFRELIGSKEFKQLGERFEKIEEQRFGQNGFQRIVQQVAQLEKALGIYELSQFTPALSRRDLENENTA